MEKIPCVMMRGGALRGTFLLAGHLPGDQTQRDKILMAVMDSGSDLEAGGIGDGNLLTSKIAIISRSNGPRAGVDCLSTQVIVCKQYVGTTPSCGNMLSGVGAFVIESDLIAATSSVTCVRIRNVNTDTFTGADVQTPNDVAKYEDNVRIDGVPGAAAPVVFTFLSAVETKAGKVLPTSNQVDYFDDVLMTYIGIAMPVIIIPTKCLKKTGCELPAELDADKALLARTESIRLQTDKIIDLGNISNMVVPKPVLIFPTQEGGAINVRYFMLHPCHRALVVVGATATSSGCVLEDTVTRQIVPFVGYGSINVEHPSSTLDVHLGNKGQNVTALRVPVIRTTRRIFSGEVYLLRKILLLW